MLCKSAQPTAPTALRYLGMNVQLVKRGGLEERRYNLGSTYLVEAVFRKGRRIGVLSHGRHGIVAITPRDYVLGLFEMEAQAVDALRRAAKRKRRVRRGTRTAPRPSSRRQVGT